MNIFIRKIGRAKSFGNLPWNYTPGSVIPPHTKKSAFRAAISVVAGGICASFYCISLKEIWWGGGYKAARGLISRDIAKITLYYMVTVPQNSWMQKSKWDHPAKSVLRNLNFYSGYLQTNWFEQFLRSFLHSKCSNYPNFWLFFQKSILMYPQTMF